MLLIFISRYSYHFFFINIFDNLNTLLFKNKFFLMKSIMIRTYLISKIGFNKKSLKLLIKTICSKIFDLFV